MIALADAGHLAGDVLALGAEIGCGYLLFAVTIVNRFSRGTLKVSSVERTEQDETPAVTILKPLHGDEAGLLRRLLSFCDQDYSGQVQIVFGCQSRFDPALRVARQVASLRPDRDVEIVVDERLSGANRKVSNLVNCFSHARHDVLIIADSDIEVCDRYIERIVTALSPKDVGAVTCLYVGEGKAYAARLSALAIDAHFLPNVLVGIAFGAATPCFGSTIALHRAMLEQIGGLRAFADKLADDYAIGEAVRGAGKSVAIPSWTVRHACQEPTLAAFFSHQLRVARTIRNIDPNGHAGSFITNPLPLAIIATALGGVDTCWLIVVVLVARAVLVRAVVLRFGGPRYGLWLQPVCDVAVFAVYVASFLGTRVNWRGHRFRSSVDGSLVASEQGSTSI